MLAAGARRGDLCTTSLLDPALTGCMGSCVDMVLRVIQHPRFDGRFRSLAITLHGFSSTPSLHYLYRPDLKSTSYRLEADNTLSPNTRGTQPQRKCCCRSLNKRVSDMFLHDEHPYATSFLTTSKYSRRMRLHRKCVCNICFDKALLFFSPCKAMLCQDVLVFGNHSSFAKRQN